MKTKIVLLFLLAFVSFTVNAYNTDLRSAERNFQNAQNEISQLASKKKATEAKLQKAEADLQEASKKMEETKDKPKSLPYKNAVKKAEASQQKIAELEFSLQSIEADIDSKSEELRNYQQIILSAQQAKEDEVAAKKQAKEDAKLAKQREKDSMKMAKQQAKEERSVIQQEQEYYVERAVEQKTPEVINPTNNQAENKEAPKASKEESEETSILAGIIYALVFYGLPILIVWIGFRRRHHCPECGKWFTMKYVRGNRTRDENQKMVFRSVRRCSNCHYERTFFEPIKK